MTSTFFPAEVSISVVHVVLHSSRRLNHVERTTGFTPWFRPGHPLIGFSHTSLRTMLKRKEAGNENNKLIEMLISLNSQ